MTETGLPTLLLVDDEPDLLFSLQGLLRQKFDLHVAESGEQALSIVHGQPIHVVMSDQRMPGMTGSELLAEIRRVSPATVRILLTGYADIQDVIAVLNSGGLFRYLTKPWNLDELMEVLDDAAVEYTIRSARVERQKETQKFIQDVSALLESQSATDASIRLIDQARVLLSAEVVSAE